MKTKERVVINVKSLSRTRREALRAEAWTAFQNGESPSALARRLRIRVRLAFTRLSIFAPVFNYFQEASSRVS